MSTEGRTVAIDPAARQRRALHQGYPDQTSTRSPDEVGRNAPCRFPPLAELNRNELTQFRLSGPIEPLHGRDAPKVMFRCRDLPYVKSTLGRHSLTHRVIVVL